MLQLLSLGGVVRTMCMIFFICQRGKAHNRKPQVALPCSSHDKLSSVKDDEKISTFPRRTVSVFNSLTMLNF